MWWTATLTIVAIIAAPITALWVQRRGDDRRALRRRREEIFRVLWVNRARPVYVSRVDALNMIDVEFYGQKKVLDAWANLFAHYNTDYQQQGTSAAEQSRLELERYAALLYEMSQVLGYEIGQTHIRDGIYRPVLHNEYESMDLDTKRRINELLKLDALPTVQNR
jgi:hypothetical protein